MIKSVRNFYFMSIITLLSAFAAVTQTAVAEEFRKPECSKLKNNAVALRFFNVPIEKEAYGDTEVIDAKALIMKKCKLLVKDLKNVSEVKLATKTFSKYSFVWLEGEKSKSDAKMLRKSAGTVTGKTYAKFKDNQTDLSKEFKISLIGNMNLIYIMVKFNEKTDVNNVAKKKKNRYKKKYKGNPNMIASID